MSGIRNQGDRFIFQLCMGKLTISLPCPKFLSWNPGSKAIRLFSVKIEKLGNEQDWNEKHIMLTKISLARVIYSPNRNLSYPFNHLLPLSKGSPSPKRAKGDLNKYLIYLSRFQVDRLSFASKHL
jgi:hypothetical protein